MRLLVLSDIHANIDAFDAVICVACSAISQKKRLSERGWDSTQIEKRIASQWPVEKKMDLANYVVSPFVFRSAEAAALLILQPDRATLVGDNGLQPFLEQAHVDRVEAPTWYDGNRSAPPRGRTSRAGWPIGLRRSWSSFAASHGGQEAVICPICPWADR